MGVGFRASEFIRRGWVSARGVCRAWGADAVQAFVLPESAWFSQTVSDLHEIVEPPCSSATAAAEILFCN